MAPTANLSKTRPEATDLERRVLAHERILQALIAYMARTEPRFVDHLKARFVEPMSMARHEHDHRETDDYAEEFIRAVMLLGEVRAPKAKEPEVTDKQPVPPRRKGDRSLLWTGQRSEAGFRYTKETASGRCGSMASSAATTTRRNMLLPLRPCTSCRPDDR
jgi:hypothetical protein